jgi:hypothetical protein
MDELLAQAQRFDGMPIRITAFLNVQFEGNVLYPTRADS